MQLLVYLCVLLWIFQIASTTYSSPIVLLDMKKNFASPFGVLGGEGGLASLRESFTKRDNEKEIFQS